MLHLLFVTSDICLCNQNEVIKDDKQIRKSLVVHFFVAVGKRSRTEQVRHMTYTCKGTATQAEKQHPQNQGVAACSYVRREVRGVHGRGFSRWRHWSFRRAEPSFVAFNLTEVLDGRNSLVRESSLALSPVRTPRELRAPRGCPALARAACGCVSTHVR